MQTAKLIFTMLALFIIVPVVAFNFKYMLIRAEGEKAKIDTTRVGIVTLAVVLIGWFFTYLYFFTADYQPLLVAERYSTAFSQAVQGRISYEEFLNKTKVDSTEEWAAVPDRDKQLIEEAKALNARDTRFQLGDEMLPKYYMDQDSFRGAGEVKATDKSPIYIYRNQDFDGNSIIYLIRLELHGNEWKVMEHMKATEEQIEYGRKSNSFIKSENSTKWFHP